MAQAARSTYSSPAVVGRPLGVAAALVALLAYSGLQFGLYGAFGPGAVDFAAAHLGLHLTWWPCALAAWLLVSVLSLARVDISSRILGVLMCLEVVAILVLSLTGITHPAGGGIALSTLNPLHTPLTGLGALVVITGLGFTGFEGGVVLTEETRDRDRTVRRATFLSLAAIAVVYTLASWALPVHYGVDGVVAASQQMGPAAMFGLASGFVSTAAQLLYLTSLFAAMLAFQAYFARYAFSLGREHVLPTGLARLNRAGAPWMASLAQSIIGGAAIVGCAVAHWDPLVRLFFWSGVTGGFGVLLLITVDLGRGDRVLRPHPNTENLGTRVIAPGVAALLLTAGVWAACSNYATVLGVPAGARKRGRCHPRTSRSPRSAWAWPWC